MPMGPAAMHVALSPKGIADPLLLGGLQVQSLWEQVAGMQKTQAELQHRTSAAEQAAQLLVGAAQRERAASAAAAAEVRPSIWIGNRHCHAAC